MTPSIAVSRPAPQTADVSELLEQRAQLQDWLARLDEVQRDADARIVERIRADYQDRLGAVLDALTGHLDALRSDLAARRRALAAAESERQGARDALEEARLRHRIGELPEAAWQERRGALEGALEEAEERCGEIGGQTAHLEEILAQVEGGLDPSAAPLRPASEPEPEPEPERAEPDPDDQSLSPTIRMDMAEIAMITASLAPQQAEPEPADEPGDRVPEESDEGQDLAFLEELDRAIEASLSASGGKAGAQEGVTADDTPQKRTGAKCPECGYTNDAEAWYCGVCGVDLA